MKVGGNVYGIQSPRFFFGWRNHAPLFFEALIHRWLIKHFVIANRLLVWVLHLAYGQKTAIVNWFICLFCMPRTKVMHPKSTNVWRLFWKWVDYETWSYQSENNKSIEVFTAFFFFSKIVNMVCYDWCILKVMLGPFKTDVALITTCYHNKLW